MAGSVHSVDTLDQDIIHVPGEMEQGGAEFKTYGLFISAFSNLYFGTIDCREAKPKNVKPPVRRENCRRRR